MKRRRQFPLNEPQERHIAVALATLERQLVELRERLARDPRNLRLTRYADAPSTDEAAALLPEVREVEARLRKIADDLALPTTTEPVRQSLVVGLEFASIHLYECRAEHGLSGYGKVAPTTDEYLEREIAQLDAAVQSLIHLLQEQPGAARALPEIP
ncbi:MAG: hypothetical protein KIS67_12600 [Verrucomicrobiae bacterium]|nr:hypothetical protein [Verrucomicrobiae bacterium]